MNPTYVTGDPFSNPARGARGPVAATLAGQDGIEAEMGQGGAAGPAAPP